MKTKAKDNFLMSPKVDYCFKELLAYSEIRKGFIAAILNKDPEEIAETTLMPTILSKDTEDGKYGILDVRVRMKNGSQMDLEMQVAPFEFWNNRVIFYLSKMYAEQVKEGDKYKNLKPCIQVSILNFNLFHEDRTCFREIAFCDLINEAKVYGFTGDLCIRIKETSTGAKRGTADYQMDAVSGAESREDFEKMAGEDNYINEAYEVLQKLSADERKRLEYEARQKAIRDYDSQMSSSREEGIRIGEDRLNHLYEKLMRDHRSDDLVKAISDKVYREKLYQEYGL